MRVPFISAGQVYPKGGMRWNKGNSAQLLVQRLSCNRNKTADYSGVLPPVFVFREWPLSKARRSEYANDARYLSGNLTG